MKLSHTKISKYKECPKSYDLYYNKKIRPDYVNSALFFGVAFDEALNVLLLNKKEILTKEEKKLVDKCPYAVFDEYFTQTEVNGETITLGTSEKARYSKYDFCQEILLDEDYEAMKLGCADYEENDPIVLRNQIIKVIEEGNISSLSKDDMKFLTLTNWIALRRKGHEMLAAYINDIYPQIERVESIQDVVTLESDDGHGITGKIDYRAKFKGYEGVVTADNKSSSNKYPKNSVEKSEQLGIYQQYTGDDLCAYTVIMKKPTLIKEKTCSECKEVFIGGRRKVCGNCKKDLQVEEYSKIETQLIVGKPNPEFLDNYFDEINDIIDKILANKFPKNIEKIRSGCYSYGARCPYYEYCKSDGINMNNLVDLRKK